MIRLDGHERIEGALRGGVIALGNFDGFHAGHQAVVGRAVHHAKDDGRPAIVATFDPHPVRFFKPDVPPFRLTTLDQRQQLFGAAGADAMLVLPFDAALAATTAEDFITELLLERYGAAGVVTGADFVFGKGRGGDVVTLADHARRLGFFTEMVAPVDDSAEVISSSRIRDALRAGDCATAARLLTRPFTVRGTVQHGDKNGRLLGFPTANIDMGTYLRPRYGIYAVTGRLLSEGPGAAPSRAPRTSASGRASIRPRNCSNRISSISTATSTVRKSTSNSVPSSGPRRSMTGWTR